MAGVHRAGEDLRIARQFVIGDNPHTRYVRLRPEQADIVGKLLSLPGKAGLASFSTIPPHHADPPKPEDQFEKLSRSGERWRKLEILRGSSTPIGIGARPPDRIREGRMATKVLTGSTNSP